MISRQEPLTFVTRFAAGDKEPRIVRTGEVFKIHRFVKEYQYIAIALIGSLQVFIRSIGEHEKSRCLGQQQPCLVLWGGESRTGGDVASGEELR